MPLRAPPPLPLTLPLSCLPAEIVDDLSTSATTLVLFRSLSRTKKIVK